MQRPREQKEADSFYSGKKKHTLKLQIAGDEEARTVCDVSESACGPTADITLLKQSALLNKLPEGVGGLGDLAYVGIGELHRHGFAAGFALDPGLNNERL